MHTGLSKTFLVVIISILWQYSYSIELSSSEAVVYAQNWVSERLGEKQVNPSIEYYSNSHVTLYIIQFDNAWAVVRSETEAKPIVAYGHGIFELNYFTKSYLNKITIDADSSDNKIKQYLSADYIPVSKLRDAVQPLLSTKWGQLSPYNLQCPEDPLSSNGHVPTGCGATVMSQLMNFWKYPTKGYGENSYNSENYGLLSIDFSDQHYNWDNMSNDDLAKINFHAGVAVTMDYGTDGSGSTMFDLTKALKTNFGYNYDIVFAKREDFSDSEWIELMKQELANGRPFAYRGDDLGKNGHIWLIDGYDDQSYFHMNWGWDGMFNGYFDIDDLDTEGYTYNDHHTILLNIQPAEQLVFKPNVTFESDTAQRFWVPSSADGTITEYDPIYLYDYAYNNGRQACDEVLVEFKIEGPVNKIVTGFTEKLGIDILPPLSSNFVGTLPVGTYTLTITADPNNEVDEIDETDNVFKTSFTVVSGGSRPEISLSTNPLWKTHYLLNDSENPGWKGEFAEEDQVFLFFNISNYGDIDLNSPAEFKVLVDDREVISGSVNSLKMNTSEVVGPLLMGRGFAPGDHTLTLVLDPDEKVAEKNELNYYYFTFSVAGEKYLNLAPVTPEGWDSPIALSESATEIIPLTEATAGEQFYLLYKFANVGGNEVSEPFKISVSIDEMHYQPIEFAQMQANAEMLLYFDLTLDAGEYKLTIELDAEGIVDEIDETDNVFTTTFIVAESNTQLFPAPSGPSSICEDSILVKTDKSTQFDISWEMAPKQYSSMATYDIGEETFAVFYLSPDFSGSFKITAIYSDNTGDFHSEPLKTEKYSVQLPSIDLPSSIEVCANTNYSLPTVSGGIWLWEDTPGSEERIFEQSGIYVYYFEERSCLSEAGTVDVTVYAQPSGFEIEKLNNELHYAYNTDDIIWYKDGVEFAWDTDRITPDESAAYRVTAKSNACMVEDEYYYELPVAVSNKNKGFKTGPNPASDYLLIHCEGGCVYELFDISLKLVQSGTVIKNKEEIDVSLICEGTYWLKLENSNSSHLEKIVVNK